MGAFAIVGADRVELGAEPATVPAGPLVLEVTDLAGATAVRLDGRPLAVAYEPTERRGTAAVDLGRYTGYHQLIVAPGERFVFATEDAKLRVAGVMEMLRFLRENGLAWRGALYFSGTDYVLRDLRLDAAWLEGRVPQIVSVAAEIAKRPSTTQRIEYFRASTGVPELGRTMRLLQREPDLLEQHPTGPLVVMGEEWAPRAIIVKRRAAAYDTQGNRRATRLLVATLALLEAVLQAIEPSEAVNLRPLREALTAALLLEPFRSLHRRRAERAVSAHPSSDELVDERYVRVRALLEQLEEERHWDPLKGVAPEYAYASYADQVYQAFVAVVLASVYGLEQTRPLAGTGPQFESSRIQMYVNTTPPKSVLRNWRSSSSRPSSLRPDVAIHDLMSDKTLIVDAKYRNDGDRASSDSLSEAQLYLQSFQRSSAVVAFPPDSSTPDWSVTHVAAEGFELIELPVRPAPGLLEFLHTAGRTVLDSAFV